MPHGAILLTALRYTEIGITDRPIYLGHVSLCLHLSDSFLVIYAPFIKILHFVTLLSDIFLEEELVQPVCRGLKKQA